ncbi:hypothetical protein Droror1_Dr00015523 [Drosera rotundifolia]
MNAVLENELSDESDYVEVDPTGRYGRYNDVLGKGSSKTVYRAFDEYEGIEVAWNKVKLTEFLQSPQDLERLYNEVHLLKTLKHKNIMKFYSSWVDTANRNINFVTEMFTSGTLRQYRLKHKKVNIRAVKHWCRQILNGLLYLHSLEPPVIHRDLKCDNIFINGNQGEVKIGDLGLAAILKKSYAAHCVGTPEFMAPEVYAEEYNELVDIYSFGMCVLEMVTSEYPYSECTNPAQIYKKVTSGKKPLSLYKVKDPEVREFIEKCLATVSCRLPARKLLKDPFLDIDDLDSDLCPVTYESDLHEIFPFADVPLYDATHSSSSLTDGCSNHYGFELDHDLDYEIPDFGPKELNLFTSAEDDYLANVDIDIKGKRKGNGDIFLRLRMADKEGHVRNIYFPFDIETDTAPSVAAEMVDELDITDQDVTRIAKMIDGEITSLVPNWNGPSAKNVSENKNLASKENSASKRYLVTLDNLASQDPRSLDCTSRQGDGGISGRFEEINHQVEPREQSLTEGTRATSSSLCSGIHAGISADRDGHSLFGSNRFDGDHESFGPLDDETDSVGDHDSPRAPYNSCGSSFCDDQENGMRKDSKWLKLKYKMQMKEFRDQLELKLKLSMLTPARVMIGQRAHRQRFLLEESGNATSDC